MADQFFADKVALVTGGTRGIGKAISSALLLAGSKVILSYAHDDQSAEATRSDFEKLGFSDDNYLIIKSNVSKRNEVRNLFISSERKWGCSTSFLVNNAGILNQGNFFKLNEVQWDQTFATNLKGPFFTSQEAMLLMRNLKNPAIVNIASVGGQTGGPNAPDYAASKAGLICLTQSMARIGAPMGIRVNAVSPGWIDTEIFSDEIARKMKKEAKSIVLLKRLGKPEEVADAVLFLLSNKAAYITGHVLNVNGGMYF